MTQSDIQPRIKRLPVARVFVTGSVVLFLAWPRPSMAASPQEISESIARAVDYLRKSVENHELEHYEAGIVAYAMIKGGAPPDEPAVKTLIDSIVRKFHAGEYVTPPTQQFYEGGTDALALSAANQQKYAGEIATIAGFIIQNQHPRGSWYYYQRKDTGGDTSVTQYAILGLWAAARCGVTVYENTWNQAARWHLDTQLSDGSFQYHPGQNFNTSAYSMTVNGVSSLCIARLHLYPNGDYSIRVPGASGPVQEEAPSEPETHEKPLPPRPGILRTLSLDSESAPTRPQRYVRSKPKSRSKSRSDATVTLTELNGGIERGVRWLSQNYNIAPAMQFPHYYLYGLERACALTGVATFRGHDWYLEGADFLVKTQAKDGHFTDQIAGPRPGTAFAILFLSRATASALGHREKLFGGGLMIGGRGLPKNLSAVQISSDGIRVRKLDAPVDQLLSELENPKSVKIESVQQAIVDSVQSGDREKLVGQKDRLKRLVRDPRPEVRRTAIWALARCSNIHDAVIFIRALDDSDLGVVIEANNALSWLSRRPKGFGRSADPLADLPEDATERQKEDTVAAWRKQVRGDWRGWFDSVRPYSEHDLPIDLP